MEGCALRAAAAGGGSTTVRLLGDTFSVGSAPTSIAFDGTHTWVTNLLGGNVTEL